jgi:phosphoserine phosphatase RsbU/P
LEVLPVHRLAVAVAPLLVGSVFAVADLLFGPTQVVLGLVVIAPLLAASVVGWRLTAAYGIGALATAVALGDALMSRLTATRGDDDTALLVVRAREVANDPRPAVALQVPVSDPTTAVSS